MPGSHAFLLGHPVSHSLSPLIQNAAFSWAGLDADYTALDVPPEELASVLARLEQDASVIGCNVTVPHKGSVHAWLRDGGRTIGAAGGLFEAVNTLWRGADGRWCGDSTDFDGFLQNLRRNGPAGADFDAWLSGRDVAILGAGGAARTLARGLCAMGERGPRSVHVFARSPEKARGLVSERDLHALAEFPAWNRHRSSLVVQATTVGMASGDGAGLSPIPSDALERGQVACDIVYKPHETPFLRDAASCGAFTVHGIGMLVGQGAVACRRWLSGTGLEKDIFPLMDTMERALAGDAA